MSDLKSSYDVVIAGGGVIGCAAAFFLARDPGFDGSVLVVERDPSYEFCSTTRAIGGIRQQFSTPENIRMSRFGLEIVTRPEDWLEVDGEVPALDFVPRGYLFLTTEAMRPAAEANHAVQRAEGAPVKLLEADEIARRFPWLNPEGIGLASFGEDGEGWFDPAALLNGFRRAARVRGVEVVHDTVSGFDLGTGRVSAVRLASGRRVACGAVVNAAGPAAGKLAALAGLPLPVGPRKRIIYIFDCREAPEGLPVTIDPSGASFRPEGRQFLCGMGPLGEDPETEDLEIDHADFDERIWPALAHRVPAFEAIKLTGAWAGHYDYNAFDRNAILGPAPDLPNFHFANGFSGHGLQQAPAAGRAIAELIIHGGWRTLDLSVFGYERIAAGRPVVERAIV